jgi:hypothetical protein
MRSKTASVNSETADGSETLADKKAFSMARKIRAWSKGTDSPVRFIIYSMVLLMLPPTGYKVKIIVNAYVNLKNLKTKI